MKRGIGTIVIIGLIVWWLTQRQEARAIGLAPKTYISESEYEKLHTYVPITRWVEKEHIVFDNLEH